MNNSDLVAANDEKSTSNSFPRKRGKAGEGVSAKGTTISDEQFTYDGVGNRTTHTQATEEDEQERTSATYNSLNQLISQIQNGVETTFTYNANGHTQTKTTGSDTTEYIYNHEERLIAVKKNGQKVGEYAYNPLGQRIKKTVNGQTTWYLYNDEGLAAEYNASGQLIAGYHFTPYSTWMTEPLFQRKGGQVYYYQNDHLGTPQRMVNATGDVVWEARYEAFGEAEIVTETVSNDLRFPGQYFDSETGLHHNYFRDYDPVTGRYVQGDPIGILGSINYFVYAANNSYSYIDPKGLKLLPGKFNPLEVVLKKSLWAICKVAEIMDFYHNLKKRGVDESLRSEIDRINNQCKQAYWNCSHLECPEDRIECIDKLVKECEKNRDEAYDDWSNENQKVEESHGAGQALSGFCNDPFSLES